MTEPDYSIAKVEKYRYKGVEYDTLEAARAAALKDMNRKTQFMALKSSHYPVFQFPDQPHYFVIKNEGTNVESMTHGGPPRALATVYGTIEQAIDYAMTLDGFWGYGPGYIEMINIVDLATGGFKLA